MTDTKKQPGYLLLLPLPLSSAQTKKMAADLKNRMDIYSMTEIIEIELRRISNWKKVAHAPTRRLYRNYTLIYTPKELGEKIRLHLVGLLPERAGVPPQTKK